MIDIVFSGRVSESTGSDGHIFPIKLIEPGWGASGYYSREVLERDMPTLFGVGTHMYWNHPTRREESERPEGDLDMLAGVVISAPVWEDAGFDGPGMYGKAFVVEPFRSKVAQIGQYIGLSIRGTGEFEEGEADGRKGNIVTKLVTARSLDFVTQAGAGGAIKQIFESIGGVYGKSMEDKTMPKDNGDDQDANIEELMARIKEQDGEITRLRESSLALQARVLIDEALKEASGLPDATISRLRKTLLAGLPTKDGLLDVDTLGNLILDEVRGAKEEIKAVIESQRARRVEDAFREARPPGSASAPDFDTQFDNIIKQIKGA